MLKIKEDCNRCDPLGGSCNGKLNPEGCKRYCKPKEGWMLAELALSHPTSLNEALSALPFETNLMFYLR